MEVISTAILDLTVLSPGMHNSAVIPDLAEQSPRRRNTPLASSDVSVGGSAIIKRSASSGDSSY